MTGAQSHLTNKYRPQTFARVVGQKPVRRILSRAAGERRIAPAYMFSGTRGVGKTTVARILAKAINCDQGPAPEPCNECHYCRQITRGASPDVQEIDGASNTGVDHVRRLNEEVGYAPLECRYKVVIIDEAHMLSRSAFNALLKTLEEPPPHATFILATTEPHKFPATIVSRCQHHVFKRIAQSELETFLKWLLASEGVDYEEPAVSLLARKGGGSVRDCVSLLSQVLALGEDSLRAETVKEVLGVAGHESMLRLMEAFTARDCAGIVSLVRELLDSGLDLGFFLQELASVWRNLFLLKQTGEKGVELLEMPREEAADWLQWSGSLPLARIHASWQMTLEGQKRVLSSMDPALSLELLLMNIAYLPELVQVGEAGTVRAGKPDADGGASPPTPPPAAGAAGSGPGAGPGTGRSGRLGPAAGGQARADGTGAAVTGESAPSPGDDAPSPGEEEAPQGRGWEGFVRFVRERQNGVNLPNLHLVQGRKQPGKLELQCPRFLDERLKEQQKFLRLQEMAREYFGEPLDIEITCAERKNGCDGAGLKEKVLNDPVVRSCIDQFQAKVLEVRPRRNGE
jgi:DNA polymerase-3 subunit gamma/tau